MCSQGEQYYSYSVYVINIDTGFNRTKIKTVELSAHLKHPIDSLLWRLDTFGSKNCLESVPFEHGNIYD